MWVVLSDMTVSHDKNALLSAADSMLNRVFMTFSLRNGECQDETGIENTCDTHPNSSTQLGYTDRCSIAAWPWHSRSGAIMPVALAEDCKF